MERLAHLAGDRGRLRGILEFNCLPASYMDVSWWNSEWMPPEVFSELRRFPKALVRLSDFICERFELPPAFDVDYQTPVGKLALLTGEPLMRLVFLAGVTRVSPWIASVLKSVDVREVKRRIGADLYDFALRNGRFLLRQTRLPQLAAHQLNCEPGSLNERCHIEGVRGLAVALDGEPEPLVRRVQLKIPKSLVDSNWLQAADNSAGFLRLFSLLERQLPTLSPSAQ